MRTQIRRGAFETNSSSTHAINIYKKGGRYEIPESIVIRPGEFGWECETYNYPEDKLSYLYTWILEKCNTFEQNEITGNWETHCDYKLLKDYQYRLKSKLEALGVKEVIFEKCGGWHENGYIDHSSSLYTDDLETILESYFEDFVFNSASYIETGNDNSEDSYVNEDIHADFSIYKGN